MSLPLKQNTTTIQNLINKINSLPDATDGGVDLPELTNEGSASDLLYGKELIDGDGKVVTGVFSIDTELEEQYDLITQIQSALNGKAAGGESSGESSGGLIPEGYALVDYIEFTGSQYIDTKIIPNKNTKAVATFIPEAVGKYLYGVIGANNTGCFGAYLGSANNWRFSDTTSKPVIAAGSAYVSSQSASGVKANNTSYALAETPSDFTSHGSLILGGNRSTSSTYASYDGKIFRFRLYQNNNLVLDYVPCKNADGAYGFWDLVSQEFCVSNSSSLLSGGNL